MGKGPFVVVIVCNSEDVSANEVLCTDFRREKEAQDFMFKDIQTTLESNFKVDSKYFVEGDLFNKLDALVDWGNEQEGDSSPFSYESSDQVKVTLNRKGVDYEQWIWLLHDCSSSVPRSKCNCYSDPD